MNKFKPRDRIRVIVDLDDDYVYKGDTGTIVSTQLQSGGYSAFLDKDVEWAKENNTKYWPVVLYEEDIELL